MQSGTSRFHNNLRRLRAASVTAYTPGLTLEVFTNISWIALACAPTAGTSGRRSGQLRHPL